jgi:Uma2 family endonuclease
MRLRAHRASKLDPTVYPVEARVGEDLMQRRIAELLRPLLERWFQVRKVIALVGADQFIYWRQHDAHKRVAPDLYVLPGVAQDTAVRSWKVWESGVVPSFAVEVASSDWEKDYIDAPALYGELGASELVVFDPSWLEHDDGVRFQVFRRVKGRRLTLVEATNEDRVRSPTLGLWLRTVGADASTRLRLALDPRGDELFPTAEEQERAAKEQERAAKEQERTAKEQALARVEQLEAELAKLRGRRR